MTEIQAQLFNMAQHSATAAELLQDAVCDGCRTCVAQISDLNRQVISDLSELERRHFTARDLSPTYLNAAQTLAACVSQAFSAAMILPDDLSEGLRTVFAVQCASCQSVDPFRSGESRILFHDVL